MKPHESGLSRDILIGRLVKLVHPDCEGTMFHTNQP